MLARSDGFGWSLWPMPELRRISWLGRTVLGYAPLCFQVKSVENFEWQGRGRETLMVSLPLPCPSNSPCSSLESEAEQIPIPPCQTMKCGAAPAWAGSIQNRLIGRVKPYKNIENACRNQPAKKISGKGSFPTASPTRKAKVT